eukprot:EG_transcript_13344
MIIELLNDAAFNPNRGSALIQRVASVLSNACAAASRPTTVSRILNGQTLREFLQARGGIFAVVHRGSSKSRVHLVWHLNWAQADAYNRHQKHMQNLQLVERLRWHLLQQPHRSATLEELEALCHVKRGDLGRLVQKTYHHLFRYDSASTVVTLI